MIRENQKILNRTQIALDVVVIVIAMFAAYYIRFWNYSQNNILPIDHYLKALMFVVPFYLLLYTFFDFYVPYRNKALTNEIINIIKVNIIGLGMLLSILFVLKEVDFSRYVLLLFALFSTILTIFERLSIGVILRHFRQKGYNLKHVLVIGAGELGRTFVSKIKKNRHLGYNIIGFLDDHKQIGRKINDIEIIGQLSDIESIALKYPLDEVFIALPIQEYDKLKDIIKIGEKSGIKVQIIPDYLKYIPAKPHIDEIDGLPIINIRHVPLDNYANKLAKRVFDIIGSLIAIIIFSPILLLTTILIKIGSPGSIIFKQERVGLNRRNFMMYKFRSMKVQKPEEEDKTWTTQDDPRKTKIGEFIRKTSIDELPQIFNVLFGDMSLIGPRPERPFFVDQFKEKIPKYMIKHQVRPGITGWAQVNGWRGDTSIKERIKCDIYYIENWTVALDIKIIILTVFKGFINKNAY